MGVQGHPSPKEERIRGAPCRSDRAVHTPCLATMKYHGITSVLPIPRRYLPWLLPDMSDHSAGKATWGFGRWRVHHWGHRKVSWASWGGTVIYFSSRRTRIKTRKEHLISGSDLNEQTAVIDKRHRTNVVKKNAEQDDQSPAQWVANSSPPWTQPSDAPQRV